MLYQIQTWFNFINKGECGEVSFRDKSTNEMKHRRFIVVNKNIVLIERRQVDQNILTFHGGMHVEIILGKERMANSNMRCDSFKSLMIINKLSKFL